jgi:hypothetical protein
MRRHGNSKTGNQYLRQVNSQQRLCKGFQNDKLQYSPKPADESNTKAKMLPKSVFNSPSTCLMTHASNLGFAKWNSTSLET